MNNQKIISRTVLLLSIVSLFTDIASEMLYPVMPVYLKSIGFSMLLIGVLEGFAESIAGLSKGYFGNLSDSRRIRLPFVRLGYALSAISKPMMAAFIYPTWIFLARTTDRLGKGIRTGARDAMLSDESLQSTKGRVFGFHRTMDTFGAVLGPAIALLLLYYLPGKYRLLFLIAFIPGILAVLFTFLIGEKKIAPAETPDKISFISFTKYWYKSTQTYKKLVAAFLIFALFNSSDVFLLLKIKESGASDYVVIWIYIFYNLIFALSSYPFGVVADKIGMKKVLIFGLFLFASVYIGMALTTTMPGFIVLFFIYGMYAAATEGVSKAWITNISFKADTATAIGTYTAFQSICALLASSIAGFIWFKFGAELTFYISGIAAILVAVYISFSVPWTKVSKF